MVNKEYLLDANIIINIWKLCPELFEDIEKAEGIDFKISRHIAEELSIKEFTQYNGVPVLTDKFLGLLDHIIDVDITNFSEAYNTNEHVKHEYKKNIFIIDDNKISKNDFILIYACEKNEKYTLVTEDKRLFNSAKFILEPSRVLTFQQFIEDLRKFQIEIDCIKIGACHRIKENTINNKTSS